MPVVDKDWVVRLVKQVGDLFARLVQLIERKEYEKAIRAIHAACPPLLGFDYEPLTFADAGSAAALLKEREKVKTFALLVAKEAEVLELKEDPSASDKRRFALELWAEALSRGAQTEADQRAGLATLAGRVGVESLGEAHQAALAKVL
jgi:hypothetical protein